MKKTVLSLALVSPFSFAAGPDFSTLTSSIDWGTTSTALLLVLGGMVGIGMVIAGGRHIYRMVKSA